MTKATDQFLIRPVETADATGWRKLFQGYLAFYRTELDGSVIDTTFSRLLGNEPGDHRGLIVEVDGKPVGLVHFVFHRSSWRVENVCYLEDLFVLPEMRGTGLGRALIEAVYAAADAAGAPDVYWLTQEFNYTGRILYDRIARRSPFVHYERVR